MKTRKKIAVVVGTRPEAIKMAPIWMALNNSRSLYPIVVSTGQHREMLDQALNVFGIRPDLDLRLMQPGQSLAELTSKIVDGMSSALTKICPDAVLLQGDTTTVLGSALAAFYKKIPVGHVEAGLRTGDILSPFPEEMNRKLTSSIVRWHFCPTTFSKANLLREGVQSKLCYVTGNTVIDALLWVKSRMCEKGVCANDVCSRLEVPRAFAQQFLMTENQFHLDSVRHSRSRWILVTGHRRESFGGGFERICHGINLLTEKFPDVGVMFPVHLNPSVQEPVRKILGANPRVALVQPAGYEDFIWLMDRCMLVLSDSGGVQEEAPSLGKPVLVMRDSTERPEGVEAGTCVLVGTAPERILAEASRLLSEPDEYARRSALANPYGDGNAAERIVKILESSLK